MRFPYQWTSSSNQTYNISDHQLVFQLAAEMNELNNHAANWSVDFIPWHQSSENGLYYYNGIRTASGLPPTVAQVAANSSLSVQTVDDASTVALQEKIDAVTTSDEFYAKIATNMFAAHAEFLGTFPQLQDYIIRSKSNTIFFTESGLDGLPGDQWSEFAYMVNYLNATLNDTDIVSGGSGSGSFWDSWYEGLYFSAAEWRTIDGGLNRLPASFHPLVDNHTIMGRKIERASFDQASSEVTLHWRDNYTDTTFQSASYDYAVVAVPFSVLRSWRLPDLGSETMADAITNVDYTAACKVALEFETRFWEHLDDPIYGSCSTSSDIPGIGSICYPSYNINGSGPATMLGSYVSGDQWGGRWASASEDEHVQYVLQAMIEIHGEVAREQYTGKYDRRCWMLDPLESASWASPSIGQHQLYLPEYFKTHNNVCASLCCLLLLTKKHVSSLLITNANVTCPRQMIFVGEHTSYTHAWIASALESGIRGSVQLMLGRYTLILDISELSH